MFAEQNDTALQTHSRARQRTLDVEQVPKTRFEILTEVWNRLLPRRTLHVTGDNITVRGNGVAEYSAEEMSDGERSVFYLIGQVLCAPEDSLIVFDEPELHIHRSILSNLWDELEALRPECGFLMISHDLEFVATRSGKKFVIDEYNAPSKWNFSEVPKNTGFDEELSTLILGSRRPVLFVEGTGESLDGDMYRSCYPDYLVIPRGSCDAVILSVKTFNQNEQLTRIGCAGIIDADNRTEEQIEQLSEHKIYPLKFNEIENVLLHPQVTAAICKIEKYDAQSMSELQDKIKNQLFALAQKEGEMDQAALRFTKRQVDNGFKSLDFAVTDSVDMLDSLLSEFITTIKSHEICEEYKVNSLNLLTTTISEHF